MQIKKFAIVTVMLFVFMTQLQQTFALDDGAYLIGRSTSYVNPLTNETEDGGSNIALGDSMANSMIEKNLLLEMYQGKMYVTIGIGLASNVSNVRFQLMDSSGSKKSVSAKVTGSSQGSDDTVKHYRIQITSLSQYIAPKLYVDPMGRDVQFFIKLNSNMTLGTGIYKSEIVKTEENKSQKSQEATSSKKETESKQVEKKENNQKTEEKTVESTTKTTTESKDITKENLMKDVQGLSYHTIQQENQSVWLYGVIGFVCLLIVGGGLFYVKKIKK